MAEIKIKTEVLESEIAALQGMLDRKEANTQSVDTKGQTGEYMQVVHSFYEILNESLDHLIENTIAFLENAKDGYIDTDEGSAAIFRQLQSEVGNQ